MLLKEIHLPLKEIPIVWCDNLSSISLASNLVFHAQTKHIALKYHFVREKVVNKELKVHHIASQDQPVDIFTKPLSISRFSNYRSKLKVLLPLNLRGAIKDNG